MSQFTLISRSFMYNAVYCFLFVCCSLFETRTKSGCSAQGDLKLVIFLGLLTLELQA